MSTRELLAAAYLDDVAPQHVGGTVDRKSLIERLGGPQPEASSDPHLVITNLARDADPGIVATSGPR